VLRLIPTRVSPASDISPQKRWRGEKAPLGPGVLGCVNYLMFPEFVASPIPLTCLKGTFDIPAAEYALAVMLAFSRKLEYDLRQRPARTFIEQEPPSSGARPPHRRVRRHGREIARRCRCSG